MSLPERPNARETVQDGDKPPNDDAQGERMTNPGRDDIERLEERVRVLENERNLALETGRVFECLANVTHVAQGYLRAAGKCDCVGCVEARFVIDRIRREFPNAINPEME